MKAGVNLERRNALKTGGGHGLLAVAGQIQLGVASAEWLKAAFEAQTKIRATAKDGITEVRVLMQHEMENGRRKDEAGNLIPAWYITEIKAHHNGKIALDGRFGTAVSKTLFGVSLHGRSDGRQNRALLAGQSGRYAFRRGGNKLIFALSLEMREAGVFAVNFFNRESNDENDQAIGNRHRTDVADDLCACRS